MNNAYGPIPGFTLEDALTAKHVHRHTWKHTRSYPQYSGRYDRLYECERCGRMEYRKNAGPRWDGKEGRN